MVKLFTLHVTRQNQFLTSTKEILLPMLLRREDRDDKNMKQNKKYVHTYS
jgi:hypothetical protein